MEGKKANVAYIISQFPRYDETFIAREMKAVRDYGIDMTIFSIKKCRDKVIHKEAEALIENVFNLPLICSLVVLKAVMFFLFTKPLVFFSALFEIIRHSYASFDFLIKGLLLFPQSCAYAREADLRKCTHIHAHWATHPATMALVMSRLTGLKVSLTGHAHDIYVNTTGLVYKMCRCEFILTCTKSNKEYLLDMAKGFDPERIIVSYHGLDLKHKYIPGDEKPDGEVFRIVSVGSCLPCKGYDRLLNAGKLLADKGFDFAIDIVGGGPLQEELTALAEELGIGDKVNFAGFVNQQDMPGYYKKADCFVLASIPEIHWGIPNVVVEAMAVELPVITTALPALPEVIENDKNGFLMDYPDPDKISAFLSKLIESPALKRTIGIAAREKVMGMFDLDNNAREVAELFIKNS